MNRRTQVSITAAAGLLPMFLYSYATGPDPRKSGAPGDQTCAQSGCHTGTALNGGGGTVVLTSATGNTYTPGQQQTLTLSITDGTRRVFGFQASARLDSNPTSGQAGKFTAGTSQIVICENGSIMGSSGCPASGSVQFLEHNRPLSSGTISILWTAPATDVGPITVYVAANAANGNNDDSGDHIYTTKLQLSAAAPNTAGPKPAISSGGVVSASAFRSASATTAGGWIEIFGANLASSTRGWVTADFNGNTAP